MTAPLEYSFDEVELHSETGRWLAHTSPDICADVEWSDGALVLSAIYVKDRSRASHPDIKTVGNGCPAIRIDDGDDPLGLGISHSLRLWASTPAGQAALKLAWADAEELAA